MVVITMTSFWRVPVFLSRGWFVIWMVVFPLVHIHPETDHAHGQPNHLHSGLYHSVFSNDLSCEFHETDHHFHSPHHKSHAEFLKIGQVSSHILGHAEIGFTLLSRTLIEQIISPPQTNHMIIEEVLYLPSRISSSEIFSSGSSPPFWLIASHHYIRPPPFLSL